MCEVFCRRRAVDQGLLVECAGGCVEECRGAQQGDDQQHATEIVDGRCLRGRSL